MLLVDPDAHIRIALRSIIETDPSVVVVGEAEDGPTATSLVSVLEPDIILMDLILPSTGGLAATREILAKRTDATVLIFSLHDDRHLAAAAIAAGAAGYLLTSDASSELIEAVRAVASGRSYVSCAMRQ